MVPRKIAALAAAAVLIVIALAAIHGIPAAGLIDRFSRDALARHDLALDVAGDARLTLWPSTGVTLADVRLRDTVGSDEIARIDRVQAAIGLGDLWGGRLRIAELTLTRPVLRTDPLFARAARAAAQRKTRGPGGANESLLPEDAPVSVGTLVIDNGAVVVRDGGETAEIRIDQLRAASLPAASGRSNLHLDARLGTATVRLTAAADAPSRLAEGRAVPIEATIEAPRLFRTPATLSASLTSAGPVLKLDSLNGLVDQGRLRGAVSVSFAGAKPFVDGSLESERLDLTGLVDAVAGPAATPAAGPRGTPAAPATSPWSDTPLNLFGLRLVDANLTLSARELAIDKVKIAPATVEATLLDGSLTAKLSPSGLYGGQASGEVTLDRSRDEPTLGLRTSFAQVAALPLLRDAAAFEYVEGRARGSLDVRGQGMSPRRIVASLTGRGDLMLEDGAIRGIDMPAMVRSVLDAILSGWQDKGSGQTRFSTFKASFTVDGGVARTTDVAFAGPYMVMSAAGNVDLRDRTLDLRADPRLVSAPETPGQRPGVWGIGVPVAIQGPWSAPRIYADTPNVLANPDGALKALRDAIGGGGQLGKVIEGLKGLAPAQGGEPPREPSALADDILRALKGEAPVPTARDAPAGRDTITPPARPAVPPPAAAAAPPRESTAPRPAPSPAPTPAPSGPVTRETRPKPPPEPTVRELEQGAREFLRDLLGR
ncbi:AsmA family protein [Rhodoplanes serenus]|uniref:AsmA family protein n=1 Tax=Rhodoplanes serenus TaxID=200615 RepID=A0A9X4XKP7_9BRAD|nr:AsmA family protein [Rhodoplanes serenus]MTW16917.1 AsmA family protein [Rhodoplanes serenus]